MWSSSASESSPPHAASSRVQRRAELQQQPKHSADRLDDASVAFDRGAAEDGHRRLERQADLVPEDLCSFLLDGVQLVRIQPERAQDRRCDLRRVRKRLDDLRLYPGS